MSTPEVGRGPPVGTVVVFGKRTGGTVLEQGVTMSTIIADQVATSFTIDAQTAQRNAFRYNGWMIAIAASTVLWAGIGVAVWNVAQFFA